MSSKADLMSSLMGGVGTQEQGLFGDVPDPQTLANPPQLHDSLSAIPASVIHPREQSPATVTNSAIKMPLKGSSFLSASGLLGAQRTNAGGRGLFETIDEEEKKKQDSERLLERRRQEEEQMNQPLEAQQWQKQVDQQQKLSDQMQSIHLGPEPPKEQSNPALNMSHVQSTHVPAHHQSFGQHFGQTSHLQTHPQTHQQPQTQPPQLNPPQNQYTQVNQRQRYQSQTQTNPQQPMIHSQPPSQGSYMHQSASPTASPHQQIQSDVQSQPNVLYRDHGQPPPQANGYGNGPRFYQSSVQGSVTAGMYGPGGTGGPSMTSAMIHEPPPQYSKVTIAEPLLLGSPTILGIGQPPHWSYHVTTLLKNGTVWAVRRRFRHVVALEDRLREECPGAILPPRYVEFLSIC